VGDTNSPIRNVEKEEKKKKKKKKMEVKTKFQT